MQIARLQQAKDTNAELLVLACPKCEIHFNCAMKDEKAGKAVKIETVQLVTLIADLMGDD